MSADSPNKSWATRTQSYSAYVEKTRATLLKDVPEVPEVELQPLLSAVLPSLSPDINFKNVCDVLLKESIVKKQWWCLNPEPKSNQQNETQVFGFVAKIFDRIVSHAKPSGSLVQCTTSGNITPFSQCSNASRPDAYVHLLQSTFSDEDESWADIVIPIEFKKAPSTEASNDDFAKILWSMHHIMRNDPRRRFVFGLTIENTSVRLWFNDRCAVVSSTAFDINEDWRTFVHIVLSITQATQDELGFDSDFKLVTRKTTSPKYHITVRSPGQTESVYCTIKIISEIGAESLIGRGTRVWKVQKLHNGIPSGPYYALKDVWIHVDRPIEHEVLAKIKNSHKEYAQHFLTIVDAGFAITNMSNPAQFDDTARTIRRGQKLVLTGNTLQPRPTSERRTPDPESGGKRKSPMSVGTAKESQKSTGSFQHTPTVQQQGHWDYLNVNRFPRRHYRIVFEEIGVPVHDLRSYQDVITAITGGSEGLRAIHLAGYVHRDVNSGNILLVRGADGGNRRGVIIDLEYIREVASESDPHDVKTGTYEFMAIEVSKSEYLHTTEPSYNLTDDPGPAIEEPPPFRQNQLHDLESVWWICMWMTFRLILPDEHPTKKYPASYWEVFQSHATRLAFWKVHDVFRVCTKHLPQQAIVRAMRYWRKELLRIYGKSYAIGKFVDVDAASLDEARSAREKALDSLSKATKVYPSNLKYLSELMPL